MENRCKSEMSSFSGEVTLAVLIWESKMGILKGVQKGAQKRVQKGPKRDPDGVQKGVQ